MGAGSESVEAGEEPEEAALSEGFTDMRQRDRLHAPKDLRRRSRGRCFEQCEVEVYSLERRGQPELGCSVEAEKGPGHWMRCPVEKSAG